MLSKVILYGTESCHKTQYYKKFLEGFNVKYQFFDVVSNDAHAEQLRLLYKNRKLNFPTITVGEKKLRNPSDKDLKKWIEK